MGICRYCGQKAAWFRHTHDECQRKAEQRCEALTAPTPDIIVPRQKPTDANQNINKLPPAPDIGKWQAFCAHGHGIITTFSLTSDSPWLSRRGPAVFVVVCEPLRLWFDPKIVVAKWQSEYERKVVPVSVDNGAFVSHYWLQDFIGLTDLRLDDRESTEVFNRILSSETLTMRVKSRKGLADVVFRVAGLKNALKWIEPQAEMRRELQREFDRQWDEHMKNIKLTVTIGGSAQH